MAKEIPTMFSKLLMFICLFMFMLNFHSSHGEQQEFELLLSFKSSIHYDPHNFLSSWMNTSSNTICKWQGITCDNWSHVNTVSLSGKNISGEVSSSMFQFAHVTNLDLSNNQLVGEVVFNAPFLSSLLYLNLSNNNFTGPLPQSLFSSPFINLETLDLSNNMFSGKIPDQIGLLSSLTYLDLGGNVLVGKIPNSITNMTSIESLTLASNQLVGEIPTEISLMKRLKLIYLGYNNLSGEIPNNIGNLLSLNQLDLVYNNLSGPIPESIGNLTNLRYIFLYLNKLTGPIPESIFQLKNLVSLDLSDNYLSGEISNLVVNLQKLEILHLFSNNFTGQIPNTITSLPHLQVLQLWSNKLTGEIPQTLGMHNNLTILDLSSNNLTGKIPNSLCTSQNLQKLILFSNSLRGEIPNGLTSCKTLLRVRLQNNELSGKLPTEITQLPQIYLLDISGNKLSGRINGIKWKMPSLQMLNLANNNFTGELPNSFGSNKLEGLDFSHNHFSGFIQIRFRKLLELVQLKLNNNNLSGKFPEEIFKCKNLVSLDLSHNQLSGEIPAKVAEMPVLGLLDLSENQFSGEIPKSLGSVESLVDVNISYNNFHGSLPSTEAFFAINASSVAGNKLCGGDSDGTNGLPPCKSDNQMNSATVLVLVCFVLTVFVTLSGAVLFVRRRTKSFEVRKVVENEDGSWEVIFFDHKASKSIKIEDVLSSVKEGKVITKGRNWVSYEGKCISNDMQFVVKEINDANSVSVSFWDETVTFGQKVKHANIVKLIGMFRCGKKVYLVNEFEDGKSLSEIMHNLSWQRRIKIALVNRKDVPRLQLNLPGIGISFIGINGFGSSSYIAPEKRKGKEVTEKSEIYSFGIMLIELLTGRTPEDIEAVQKKNNIVEWARYCYTDCHLDTWIDPVIMKGEDLSAYQNDIVDTMNLALHCTAGDPTTRPCARDVVKVLETVQCNRITFC
ncbi:unnamed protein product [Vicia faba]|uniref:Protein kinase domain-containing protein n=1 Tax=Vicia faba TaxID=3906 RepID=A0AAV0ZQB9_VICFA|nr:unnamed protein product [Vicia faba]